MRSVGIVAGVHLAGASQKQSVTPLQLVTLTAQTAGITEKDGLGFT